jgi:hypothetical protein
MFPERIVINSTEKKHNRDYYIKTNKFIKGDTLEQLLDFILLTAKVLHLPTDVTDYLVKNTLTKEVFDLIRKQEEEI